MPTQVLSFFRSPSDFLFPFPDTVHAAGGETRDSAIETSFFRPTSPAVHFPPLSFPLTAAASRSLFSPAAHSL